jgi:spore germination cell wall hydrolase CwlJ-like protein
MSLPSLETFRPGEGWVKRWAGISVLVVLAGLYLMAALSVTMNGGGSGSGAAVDAEAERARLIAAAGPNAKALLEPQAVRPLDPNSAAAINAEIPIADVPNPAASPLALRFASVADRARSLQCLTEAVYYEAATEPLDGQRAVAQVVLNRVRHPAYPNSVCGVVYQGHERRTGCQFSFTCDGSLGRAPMMSLWNRARQVAAEALAGGVYAPVGYATHYHANYVVPYWASSLVKSAEVGAHIFYRWTGGWGRPGAFTSRYVGVEPSITRRRNVAPLPTETPEALAAEAATRDEAAALAAEQAKAGTPAAPGAAGAPTGSVDSFNRAVLRRYEPLRRENATAVIEQRNRTETMSASSRWALTGGDSGDAQTPLGGVRRRAPAAAAGAEPAPKAAAPTTSADTPAP